MIKCVILDNLVLFPGNASIDRESVKEVVGKIKSYIEEGYEIVSAVQFSTADTAGIEYVLRKETTITLVPSEMQPLSTGENI